MSAQLLPEDAAGKTYGMPPRIWKSISLLCTLQTNTVCGQRRDGSSPWTCGGVKMELNASLVLITSVENEAELVLNRSLQENWFNPLHYRSTDGMRRHDATYKIKLSHFPGWGRQHTNVYLYHYSSTREGTFFIYAQVSGPSWFKSMKALEQDADNSLFSDTLSPPNRMSLAFKDKRFISFRRLLNCTLWNDETDWSF